MTTPEPDPLIDAVGPTEQVLTWPLRVDPVPLPLHATVDTTTDGSAVLLAVCNPAGLAFYFLDPAKVPLLAADLLDKARHAIELQAARAAADAAEDIAELDAAPVRTIEAVGADR